MLLDNHPPGSSDINCPPTTDLDTYELDMVDFDVYDGRWIRVFADNPHADAAQMNDVLLDVRGMLFTYVTRSRETSRMSRIIFNFEISKPLSGTM